MYVAKLEDIVNERVPNNRNLRAKLERQIAAGKLRRTKIIRRI